MVERSKWREVKVREVGQVSKWMEETGRKNYRASKSVVSGLCSFGKGRERSSDVEIVDGEGDGGKVDRGREDGGQAGSEESVRGTAKRVFEEPQRRHGEHRGHRRQQGIGGIC